MRTFNQLYRAIVLQDFIDFIIEQKRPTPQVATRHIIEQKRPTPQLLVATRHL